MGFYSLVKEKEYLQFTEYSTPDGGLVFTFHRDAVVGTVTATGVQVVWNCNAVGVSSDPYITISSIETNGEHRWKKTQKKFYEFDFIKALVWLEENVA